MYPQAVQEDYKKRHGDGASITIGEDWAKEFFKFSQNSYEASFFYAALQ